MYLQLDTKFNPFTYDEMVKPLLYYKQAYDAAEADYSNLVKQTETWKNIANQENSPEAYAMYQRYAGDLERAAADFSKGMNTSNRRALLGLKGRYYQDIQPIADASKRREALAEEQRKAIAADPTRRYQRMASSMSLDDFIDNPSADYGQSYSGALLTKQVSEAAANLQKALLNKGNLKNLGLPYQYERMLQYGASPSQVLAAMGEKAQNEPETATFLRNIVDQVMDSSGVSRWANADLMNEFRAYANQGLYSAIGQAKIDSFKDDYSMKAALDAAEYNRKVNLLNAQNAQQEQNRLKMYNINPTTLYGSSEISERNKSIKKEIDTYRNKGYITSKGQLTKEGIKALQGATYVTKQQRGPTGYVDTKVQTGDWDFKRFALSNGQTQSAIDSGLKTTAFDKYIKATMSGLASGKLVTGSPNIDVYRQAVKGSENQKFVLNKVTAAIGDGQIHKVGDLKYSGTSISMGKGDGISAEDLRKKAEDNPILYIINSPTTNNQLIELTNGEKYILPSEVLDNINLEALSSTNTSIINSDSLIEKAVNLNRANSFLGSILNYNEGTSASTNDNTIDFSMF